MADDRPNPTRVFGEVTNVGGDSYWFWLAEIKAARKQWESTDSRREEIRKLISELQFPILMVSGELAAPAGQMTGGDDVRRAYPHVDQIPLNLPIRYTQKLTSNVGDEEAEMRWSRDWTPPWNEKAHLFDTLMKRSMGRAGAWENNRDGALDVCSDGCTTFWVGLANEAPVEHALQSTESPEELIDRILRDPLNYAPVDGQDHVRLGEMLEAQSYDAMTLMKDPSGVVSAALQDAASKHYKAHEEKRKKGKLDWRHEALRLTHERLPYGTHALMDSRSVLFRQARWAARLIRIPVQDARKHPAFHPAIRKQLQPDRLMDPQLQKTHSDVSYPNTYKDTIDEQVGLCSIWEIHDRRTLQIIYLNEGVEKFLNAGSRGGVSRMRHPFLDAEGRPLIPPAGAHPGFFPCDHLAPQLPKRDNEHKKEGVPLLEPGRQILYAIVKGLSHYMATVKRASSAMYEAHPALSPEARQAIKMGIDGTIFTRPADVPPGETLVPVQWKAPSEQLFRQISELIGYWCMVQSFPMAELTTQPQASTVGQEEMGLMAGDVWMLEIVRKFEISCATQAHIWAHVMSYYSTKADWAELVGLQNANELWEMVKETRIPPGLPAVRYASKRRDAHPVRVNQLATLDERVATDVDPLYGIPRWSREHFLQEMSNALDAGRLVPYKPDEQGLRMLVEAKGRALAEKVMTEIAGGESTVEGGAPARQESGPEQPEGPPQQGVEERPAVGGSPGGSASQDRGSEAAKRSRRGGRRGRAGGPTTIGTEMSTAVDTETL